MTYRSYHLLIQALAPSASREHLFAGAVRRTVQGFVRAIDYDRRAQLLAPSPPREEALLRRVRELVASDLNPVCALLAEAADPQAFAQRWNGLHGHWRVGTDTVVQVQADGRMHYHREVRDCSGEDTELKQRVMRACLQAVGSLSRGAPGWPQFAAALGLEQSASGELALLLDAHPGATLEEAAAQLGCSPRTLERQLAACGTGFVQLRSAVRITRAARLLRDRELPLTEVAQCCGFYDSAHFARAFRAACGVTASQYRRLAA